MLKEVVFERKLQQEHLLSQAGKGGSIGRGAMSKSRRVMYLRVDNWLS
jgi:hypothetical protein